MSGGVSDLPGGSPPRADARGGGPVLFPVRVQLSRAKGWRMPAGTLKVDRSTKWGNPYRAGVGATAITPEVAVALLRQQIARLGGFLACADGDFAGTPLITVEQIRAELKGWNLGCWCALGQPCHANVLLELANGEAA